MFYFIINIVMYFVVFLLLVLYFHKKMNLYTFLLLLFNLNLYFILIERDVNFLYGVMISLIMVILYHMIITLRKGKKEIILIREGNINFHDVIKYYSLNRLMNYLKFKRIKLEEIEYCIKNSNGLIVIRNDNKIHYPVSIIVDGNLLESNLKFLRRDEEWLARELLRKNLLISKVDYAYYKNDKIYFVT